MRMAFKFLNNPVWRIYYIGPLAEGTKPKPYLAQPDPETHVMRHFKLHKATDKYSQYIEIENPKSYLPAS